MSFQPQNITTLCNAPIRLAESMCPSLIEKATELSIRFSYAFQQLGDCHRCYNKTEMNDDDIENLG